MAGISNNSRLAAPATGRQTHARRPPDLPGAAGNGGGAKGVARMEHGGIRGDHATEAPYCATLDTGYSLRSRW